MDNPIQDYEFLDLSGLGEDDLSHLRSVLGANPEQQCLSLPWSEEEVEIAEPGLLQESVNSDSNEGTCNWLPSQDPTALHLQFGEPINGGHLDLASDVDLTSCDGDESSQLPPQDVSQPFEVSSSPMHRPLSMGNVVATTSSHDPHMMAYTQSQPAEEPHVYSSVPFVSPYQHPMAPYHQPSYPIMDPTPQHRDGPRRPRNKSHKHNMHPHNQDMIHRAPVPHYEFQQFSYTPYHQYHSYPQMHQAAGSPIYMTYPYPEFYPSIPGPVPKVAYTQAPPPAHIPAPAPPAVAVPVSMQTQLLPPSLIPVTVPPSPVSATVPEPIPQHAASVPVRVQQPPPLVVAAPPPSLSAPVPPQAIVPRPSGPPAGAVLSSRRPAVDANKSPPKVVTSPAPVEDKVYVPVASQNNTEVPGTGQQPPPQQQQPRPQQQQPPPQQHQPPPQQQQPPPQQQQPPPQQQQPPPQQQQPPPQQQQPPPQQQQPPPQHQQPPPQHQQPPPQHQQPPPQHQQPPPLQQPPPQPLAQPLMETPQTPSTAVVTTPTPTPTLTSLAPPAPESTQATKSPSPEPLAVSPVPTSAPVPTALATAPPGTVKIEETKASPAPQNSAPQWGTKMSFAALLKKKSSPSSGYSSNSTSSSISNSASNSYQRNDGPMAVTPPTQSGWGPMQPQNKTSPFSPQSRGFPPPGAIPSGVAPGLPPPNPAHDPALYRLSEWLHQCKLDHKPASLQPRGLTNRNNWCYINATLQALLACPPFYNLFKEMPDVPTSRSSDSHVAIIDSMKTFVKEFQQLPASARLKRADRAARNKQTESLQYDIPTGTPFEPTCVYRMLSVIQTDSMVEGRQEDAEEFLSCLLNSLNDEMLDLMKITGELPNGDVSVTSPIPPSSNGETAEEGDEWKVMGPKNKGSVERRADFGRTPLSDIFRGQLRSRVVRSGQSTDNNITDNVQPFFTLQLDIENSSSVKEALEAYVRKDVLEGLTCSRSNQEIKAWNEILLDELPPVLLLHLKWFDYSHEGCSKILKTIRYDIDLKVDSKLLSSKKPKAPSQQHYKLFAVVYHDGKEATKGHYVTDAFHVGYNSWIRYDDSNVKVMSQSEILSPRPPRVPYLLYYRRLDTLDKH